MCNINYPKALQFNECPVCGVPTNYFSNVEVDEDWLDLAETMARVLDGNIMDDPDEYRGQT